MAQDGPYTALVKLAFDSGRSDPTEPSAVFSMFPLLLGQGVEVYFDANTTKMKRQVGYLAMAVVGLDVACILTNTGQQACVARRGPTHHVRPRLLLLRYHVTCARVVQRGAQRHGCPCHVARVERHHILVHVQ